MSDAARLASLAFAGKPGGTPYGKFSISPQISQSIEQQIPAAIMDTAYSAIISYAEAIYGINKRWSSWAIIRLYYASFYCLKTMMLARSVIPFNSGGEMFFDVSTGKFLKGGRSSHHWNWHSVRQTVLKHDWFTSQDSEDAYTKLRTYRENVNYTHAFPDPNLHRCLVTEELDLARKFRVYRDDTPFTYTYLNDHLAVAYPTKLIFELDSTISGLGYQFEPERLQHLHALWNIRDRCPLT